MSETYRRPTTSLLLGTALKGTAMRRVAALCMLVLFLLTASCGQPSTPAGAPPTPAPALSAPSPTPPQLDKAGTLAYVQGGDVWARSLPDGPARRLTTSGDASAPRWSPSGNWLRYCAGDQLH